MRAGSTGPLDTLLGYTYANTDDVVIYAESASFLKFVYERYGPAALRQLWQQSLAPTAAHLGATPATIEAAWRTRLTMIPAADRHVDWDYVRTKGCE